jgi:molecular chaperone Hsp33
VTDRDLIRRFFFEHSPVRGHIVHLDSAWAAMCEHHDYPAPIQGLLGEAAAAVTLIASTRKFDGTLTLQLQGPGPMHLLVAQCTHGFALRGVARWSGVVPAGPLTDMAGEGRLTVSVETLDLAARYQGIVPLAPGRLAECLEAYFRDSEQLPTRIWLATTPAHAAGLLLQRLPGGGPEWSERARAQEDPQEAWARVEHLASTLTPEELLALPQRDVMRRLFHQEDVRVFEPAPVFFQCRCSRERVIELLRALGEEEIRGIVAERGAVQARCEFCNRAYDFDAIDAEQLFRAQAEVARSGMLQ